jgi:1-acyl-sn-glycerol-3-phosphate acyltransferase
VLRFCVAAVLFAFLTAALGAPAILLGAVGLAGAVRRVTRAWARGVLWAGGIRVDVLGASNVPGGPALYAANHTSALDIPLLFAHLPVDFRILHKRSLFLVPVIGWYLWVGGHIGIARGSAFKARRSLERAADRMRRGTSVAVFPEGTRSRTGVVGPFKRASFLLAVEAGVPVVPVSLCGVRAILPGGPVVRPGRVRLVLHPAVPPVAHAADGADAAGELAERVRRIVAAGCEAA